eukprot:768531-Hanusia_phi.AAC.2
MKLWSKALVVVMLCLCCRPVAGLELPEAWQKVRDQSTGKYYYWNTLSGETQWERPWSMKEEELDDPDDMVTGAGIEDVDHEVLRPTTETTDDLFDYSDGVSDDLKEEAKKAMLASKAKQASGKKKEAAAEEESTGALSKDFFSKSDADGNGGLDEKEFTDALKQLNFSLDGSEEQKELKEFFEAKRKHGKGLLGWQEWKLLVEDLLGSDREEQGHSRQSRDQGKVEATPQIGEYDKEVFDSFDLDGSGELDRHELLVLLRNRDAPEVAEGSYSAMMEELDKDDNGALSLHEWYRDVSPGDFVDLLKGQRKA